MRLMCMATFTHEIHYGCTDYNVPELPIICLLVYDFPIAAVFLTCYITLSLSYKQLTANKNENSDFCLCFSRVDLRSFIY